MIDHPELRIERVQRDEEHWFFVSFRPDRPLYNHHSGILSYQFTGTGRTVAQAIHRLYRAKRGYEQITDHEIEMIRRWNNE